MLKNYQNMIIKKEITLENGELVVITEEIVQQKGEHITHASRNVYKFNKNKELIWQIKSKNDKDGNPFINVYIEDGQYVAYRWNGGVYSLDLESGIATPLYLAK